MKKLKLFSFFLLLTCVNGLLLGQNIGINTANPYTTLDVKGNIFTSVHASNNLHAVSEQVTRYIGHQSGNDIGGNAFTGMKIQVGPFGRSFRTGNNGSRISFQTWGNDISYSREVMTINEYGRVGIGTTTPDAPLHIASPGITNSSMARTFFGYNTTITNNRAATDNIKVHANGNFWADGGFFVATSDKRIKNIIGQTNTANDLTILNKIQITDYKYKDEISNGSGLQKKVIAQQLQEVYPIAVNSNKGIIPNVFDKAKTVMVNGNVTIISTNKPHDFKTGDKVKLILEKTGEKIVEITVVNDTQFTVNEAINDNIFIYGKYVNDLLNVDYDAVAMLNVSATQELAKQVEALKKDNHNLRKENEELRKLVLNIQAKLEGNISANTK